KRNAGHGARRRNKNLNPASRMDLFLRSGDGLPSIERMLEALRHEFLVRSVRISRSCCCLLLGKSGRRSGGDHDDCENESAFAHVISPRFTPPASPASAGQSCTNSPACKQRKVRFYSV